MSDNNYAELGRDSFGEATLKDVQNGYFNAAKADSREGVEDPNLKDTWTNVLNDAAGGFVGRGRGLER